MRLEPDPLRLRPFEDERDFAVVRLRPLLEEPLPFDELLLRLDGLLLRLDELLLRLPLDDALERPPDDELRPEVDFDFRDDELRLRELDEEVLRLTSPSSITPRQDPLSSSSISMYALKRARSARTARFTWRIPRPAFSISEPGSTSRLTSMRVSRSDSSWKLTTPVCVTPSVTFHLIR